MKATLEQVKEAARRFLEIADELNEAVSRFINYSDEPEDEAAYRKVRDAEEEFIIALNSHYDESYKGGLNYELAESFL